MNESLRQQVRERADFPCDYCRLAVRHIGSRMFQIEHIIARQHFGNDHAGNLALACRQCNLHKGPNLTGIDPDSMRRVRLYHPRRDSWAKHFCFDGPRLVGITPIGRTTVWVLQMNTEERLELRSILLELGDLE